MKLTPTMKREIANYAIQYTKGLIEDDNECPELCKAMDDGSITSGQIEDFVDELRTFVLTTPIVNS